MRDLIVNRDRQFADDLVGKIIDILNQASDRWLHLPTILTELRDRYGYEAKDGGRLVREAMAVSGQVLSIADKKHGYCVARRATREELEHATAELLGKAKSLKERATKQRWAWFDAHPSAPPPPPPLTLDGNLFAEDNDDTAIPQGVNNPADAV